MNLGPNLVTLAGGAGVLALCAILLSANRRRDALVKLALGAVIGAIAYPLGLLLAAILAQAMTYGSRHFWMHLRRSMALYVEPIFLLEIIPRGIVLGAFVAVSWSLWQGLRVPRTAPTRRNRFKKWCLILASALAIYILTSGPIIATAFRLRELTGRNGYYDVIYAYVPLMALGGQPFQAIIRWWLTMFRVVDPM